MATGHTPSRKHPEYWGGDIPWMNVGDARPFHGRVIHETSETTNSLGIDNSAAVVLPAGTVCLSRTGSIGYAVILGRPMATSQGFVNWICGPELLPEFLQQSFLAEQAFLHEISEGVAHTTIYFPQAKAFHICIPNPEKQRRIVADLEKQLSRLDEGVANLKRAKANLKRYKAAVLKAAVEGHLVPTEAELARREKRDFESAVDLMQRTLAKRRKVWRAPGQYIEPPAPAVDDLPPLPEGWTYATAHQISDANRPITYGVIKLGEHIERGVSVLRSSDVRPLRIDLGNVKRVAPGIAAGYKRTLLGAGEIVVTVRGTLGGVAVVPKICRGFNVSREVAVLALVEPECAPALVTFIAAPSTQRWLLSRAKGIAYIGINIETLRRLPLPIPPMNEQRRIAAEVERRLSAAEALEGDLHRRLGRAAVLRERARAEAFEILDL